MATTKAAILIFVNAALNTEFTAAQIEPELRTVLQKLSDNDLLIGSDDTNYPANTVTITQPTGFRSEIALTPTNAAGVENDPLLALPGGYQEYRTLKSNDANTGIPEFYTLLNKVFYIWRPLNAIYNILIDFYKNHALDVDDGDFAIEFGDEFTDAINSGVTYYKARNQALRTYMGDWKIEWFEALANRIASFPRQPHIS